MTSSSCLIGQPRFCFSEQIVTKVLDELGIQMSDELSKLPAAAGSLNPAAAAKAKKAQAEGGGGGLADADADLEARLENLRRD